MTSELLEFNSKGYFAGGREKDHSKSPRAACDVVSALGTGAVQTAPLHAQLPPSGSSCSCSGTRLPELLPEIHPGSLQSSAEAELSFVPVQFMLPCFV